MLPKEKSPTTSWTSGTSSRSTGTQAFPLSPELSIKTPVQFVKGIGPGLGSLFTHRGLKTVWDLISFFPKSYQDRSEFVLAKDLKEGEVATLSCTVKRINRIPIQRGRKTIFEVLCEDETGMVSLKWFHYYRGLESQFKPGNQVIVTGKPKFYKGRFEIIHPEVSQGEAGEITREDAHTGRIVPFYVEIEGISSRILRRVIWNALEKFSQYIEDDIPLSILEKYNLPRMRETIRALHFPPTTEDVTLESLNQKITPFQQRYIFDEFFKFEFLILQKRLQMQKDQSEAVISEQLRKDLNELKKSLPFSLTNDQEKALQEIADDFISHTPMNRLLQGDVGSGKTVVSLLSAAALIAQGSQAVLMAPTEILAEQHFKNALIYFGDKLKLFFLTGSTPQSERVKIFSQLEAGVPCLIIGTHALFEEPVQFKNLNLIMIDEQHRFGVDQRRRLIEKGIRKDIKPHILVMTATPIPRTLALTVYGDLSVSLIKQKPPGRTPVLTQLARTLAQRKKAMTQIRKELAQGRQAYFIFPLVDESEAEGFEHLKSVIVEAEKMQYIDFPEYKVGVLHGKFSAHEKSEIMSQFKQGKINVLVSTTVIEVGVDVPNSTIMVIEHSERFGLSQLHQLRGRVGRGSKQSYCYLMAQTRLSEVGKLRLSIMEKSEDGFFIAEEDLKIRGPGEFLGTRQSGALPFVMADLVRDSEWLYRARDEALALLREDPDLLHSHNLNLKRYIQGRPELSV